jgi:hypothetical protein
VAYQDVTDPAGTRESRWSRVRRLRDWYIPGLIVAFVLFCLGPSLVGARSLLSINLLTRFYPWAASGADDLGHQACTTDTVDNIMPGIAYIRSQLFMGHLGSWQNTVLGGGPMGSVPNVGLFDPISLPYLVMPLWLAPAFVKLLEIVVAVGGTYLFLRRLDVGRPAATLAGFIFATSGFMVMWSNWPQTRVAALIPALFWAVERLVQRRQAGDVALIALVIGSMLFGGFPAVTGWAVYFAAVYVVVRVVVLYRTEVRKGVTTLGLAAGGLVLGGMLSAVQMLPFASLYQSTDLSYRAGRGNIGLPYTGLFTLMVPDSNGLCIVGGTPQHGSANPIEVVAYIGAAALVLAVVGIAVGFVRRGTNTRGVWSFLIASSAFVVVLVYFSPRLRALLVHLPVFSNNPVPRLRSILGFTLAALAGVGFDALLRSRAASSPGPRARQVRRIAWAVTTWLVIGAAGLVVLRQMHANAIAGHFLNSLERQLVAPGLILVVTLVLVCAVAAGVVIVARSGRVSARSLAFVVLPVLVVVQGASFFHAVLPGDNPADFYPKTPAHKFLAANLGHDRFASSRQVLYPATALYYGLRTPTGHGFTDTAWQNLLEQVDPAVMQTATVSAFTGTVNENTIGNSPALDVMAVKYFALPPEGLAGSLEPVPPSDGSVSIANGTSMTCTLPARALRGVTVQLAAPLLAADAQRGVTVDIAASAGGQTVRSARFLGAGQGRVPLSVALAGESLGGKGPVTVTVGARGASSPMVLASSAGAPVCAPVYPKPDKLRLVYADAGTIIYQRLTALPRIRWASTATVIADRNRRLAALKAGVSRGGVVLDAPDQLASGLPGTVAVRSDRGGYIAADVNAQGAGYLVIGDAMQQHGWSVTVDGKPAKLVAADHAEVAVAVPAGQHRIVFGYRAPGLRVGAVSTAVALLIIIALFVWERRRRREPQRVAAHAAVEPVLATVGGPEPALDPPVEGPVAR